MSAVLQVDAVLALQQLERHQRIEEVAGRSLMQRKLSLKRRQVGRCISQSAEHAEFNSTQECFGCPKAQTNLHNMFRCCCAHDLTLQLAVTLYARIIAKSRHGVIFKSRQTITVVTFGLLDAIGWAADPSLQRSRRFRWEMAFAAVSLMTNGVLERFPRGCGFCSITAAALSWILPRLQHAYALGPPLQSLFAKDPEEIATTQFSMTARRCNTWPAKLGQTGLSWDPTTRSPSSKIGLLNSPEQALPLVRDAFSANARRLLGLGLA